VSAALEYLAKARPEAMQAYFGFLREAGRHLDPKTRALISVITKVAAQTDDGFRQYVSRALHAGLSANEILDGLLMAFPALGLSKIVWAVDILLQMDIPEFRIEDLQQQTRVWHHLADVASLPARGTQRLACAGRELFVRADGGQYVVFDSRCPHQATNIPELALDGERLVCPRHGWVFDLATGACVAKGDRPLRRFESRIEEGRLLALW
jgi:nitrite reductase/ring-hydroxylating ferredoxin subunit/alkylhydroperoxidase/carboxymuconolactone decarboxylase family protein YurZ